LKERIFLRVTKRDPFFKLQVESIFVKDELKSLYLGLDDLLNFFRICYDPVIVEINNFIDKTKLLDCLCME